MAEGPPKKKFIPEIAEGLRVAQSNGDNVHTLDFVVLMDKIIIVFEFLGPILAFAKADMHSKAETLRTAASVHPTLGGLVEADKKAGLVATKNSCARNLHRLTSVLKFMRLLLIKLVEGPTVSLKDAANFAYEAALAPIHPYSVRTAVWAGMYMLPTRQTFLASIGETEQSAKAPAEEFSKGAEDLEKVVLGLYDAEMPASDVAPTNMFSGSWWGTSATAPA